MRNGHRARLLSKEADIFPQGGGEEAVQEWGIGRKDSQEGGGEKVRVLHRKGSRDRGGEGKFVREGEGASFKDSLLWKR